MTRNLGSTDLKRLHREWRRQAPGRISLLLDSVATPANVGSILRTAAALAVTCAAIGYLIARAVKRDLRRRAGMPVAVARPRTGPLR